jgi:DNA-binding NarL/FixJ family response regulator
MHSKTPFDAQTRPGSAGTELMAPVVRLRPIRTLVITPDLAYRERAWLVLSELGPVAFTLAELTDSEDIAGLLHEHPADVVLLDATGCETAAHEVIAALAETAPRTGIVVVCHHCTDPARELRALPKWGWTQDLRAAVEHAYREGNPLRPAALGALRRRSPWQRMAGPLLRRG